MHYEKYNYSTSTVPVLKRKMRWNVLFAIIMISIILLEVFMMVHSSRSNIKLSLTQNIVSIVTLVFALCFVLVQIAEVAKAVALIKKIKKDGYFQADTLLMNFDKKSSFGNILRLTEYILLLITIVAVVGFATYSVWQYIYSSIINYYLPLLLCVLVSTYYSCKNIDNMYILKRGM